MRRIAFALLCLWATASAHAQTRPLISGREFCSELEAIAADSADERAQYAARVRGMACQLPTDDIDVAEAEAILAGASIRIARDADIVTVIARSPNDEAHLCCSLQVQMTRIVDSNYFASRFRLAELDRAIISLFPPEFTGQRVPNDQWATYRGPNAPPAPELTESIAGRIVETTLWSPELQETRKLVIYLPPGHQANGDYAALVVADGNSVNYYARMLEPLMERGEIEPLVLIGIPSGQPGIVEDRSALNLDLRAADYLPGWENAGDRFDQHMRFVTETLMPHAEREYAITRDRHRRAVSGFSNGAVFAYWAAILHPDQFGISIVRSYGYGGSQASAEQIANPLRARFFMSGGLYEARFWITTNERAETLRAAGYEVQFLSMAAGHAPDQGNITLAEFVRAALPAR